MVVDDAADEELIGQEDLPTLVEVLKCGSKDEGSVVEEESNSNENENVEESSAANSKPKLKQVKKSSQEALQVCITRAGRKTKIP